MALSTTRPRERAQFDKLVIDMATGEVPNGKEQVLFGQEAVHLPDAPAAPRHSWQPDAGATA